MLNAIQLQAAVAAGGTIATAAPGDPAPGDLAQLAGTWQNTDNLMRHGRNMIALPYKTPGRTVNPDTPDQNSDFSPSPGAVQ